MVRCLICDAGMTWGAGSDGAGVGLLLRLRLWHCPCWPCSLLVGLIGCPHPVEFLAKQGLERFIPAGEKHNVVGGDDIAAGVFGEEVKIVGRVLDLGVDKLRQGADELRGGIKVGIEGVEGGRVDELADGVPEGGFEPLHA